jgi:hypothetical protein
VRTLIATLRVDDRIRDLVVFGPIILLLVLIGMGVLILLAPSAGGTFADVHSALRDRFAGDERVYADPALPAILAGAQGSPHPPQLPSEEETVLPALPALPAPPTSTIGVPCASLHFEASMGIEGRYLSFGRFNVVSDTDPYGRRDVLTSWKLLQFGGFFVSTEALRDAWSASIPVNQTVNLLISDPYTEEMLFSAKWRVEAIEVRGRYASINAELGANLDSIGINNVIDSPTLESFAEGSRGVLVMRFAHTEDIAPALAAGEPVYAPVSGMMYPEHCFE